MLRVLFSLLLVLALGNTLFAQVEGLWEVRLVKVGNETPTPTAKWFDLKPGGTLLSGNGGVINQRGAWRVLEAGEQLLFSLPDGSPDPAGPFQLSLEDTSMTWLRTEEGMRVEISLERIQDLPMASWDYLPGTWQIQKIVIGGAEMTEEKDPKRKFQLFFRWDNLFMAQNDPEGRAKYWGSWQLHSHNSKLRLFALDGSFAETWTLESINDQAMTWSQDDQKWVFVRR